MYRGLLEQVRALASGERALETLSELARFHRVQASPGYAQASAWMAERLESLGLVPEIETVPGDGLTRFRGQLMPEGWEASHAVATLVEGERREGLCDYRAERLSLILRSAPARGRYRLVAVEDGAEEDDYDGIDVRGAVVMVRGSVQRAHALAVVERGAAGLLSDGRRLLPPVRGPQDDPDQIAYTSFWWSGDEPRGWGFVVSPARGAVLRERLAGGAPLELEVEIESRRFPTPIPLLSARLPGTAPGEILIVSHLCHPEPSANDNASGAAAALETARVLAGLRGSGVARGRGVRFLWMPELTGSHAWIARDPERARGVVAALNLDMVGEDQERCGSTFLLEHPPCFAASFAEEILGRIREQAVDWVQSYSGAGHYSMTRLAEVPYSGGSDHAAFIDPAVGIPCPMLIQWPDRFYHSSHDTPDKSDPRSLALAVRCAATYAGFLAGAGEREGPWILEAVARGARRRVLAALDRADPGREVERERMRHSAALASLERLWVGRRAITEAARELERFVARETHGVPAPDLLRMAPGGTRPRRRGGVALDAQRHLLDGYATLPRETRERWRSLERRHVGAPIFELAWFACDGRRTLAEIARLVWIETGQHEPEAIGEVLEIAARLGLCEG